MMKYGKRKHFATFVPMQIYNERFFTPRGRRQESLCNMCSRLPSTTHALSKRQKKMMVSLVAANSETLMICVKVAFTHYYAKSDAKGHHDLAGMTAAIKGS